MSALVTLAKVKSYLLLTGNTYDVLLNMLIANVSGIVETFTNRKFELAVYEELYTGDGTYSLMLDNYPVVDVYYLSQDLNKDDKITNSLIAPHKYLVQPENGIVEQFDDIFWMFFGQYQGYYSGIYNSLYNRNIYCKYLAGYADIPDDIQSVCLDIIAKKFAEVTEKRVGVQSRSQMGESVNFRQDDLTESHKTVLWRYKKPAALKGMTVSGWSVQS